MTSAVVKPLTEIFILVLIHIWPSGTVHACRKRLAGFKRDYIYRLDSKKGYIARPVGYMYAYIAAGLRAPSQGPSGRLSNLPPVLLARHCVMAVLVNACMNGCCDLISYL